MKDNQLQDQQGLEETMHEYAGVRALVLGAPGFLGRLVAKALSAAGADLVLPVRDITAAKRVFEDCDVKGELIELDLRDGPAVQEMIRSMQPTITFNLAGYGIDRMEKHEDTAYQINARLVEFVCKAIAVVQDANWQGQDIIHAGTAMEYGSIQGDLEEDSVPNPTTLYGRSKLAGTLALASCCRRYRIKGLTARLFAVYGPGESPERLLPTLIRNAKTSEPIPLTAGLHKRDFVYVEDAVEGLLRLGVSGECKGGIVNLATGNLTSVREFVETAASVIGISDDRLAFGLLPTRPEEMHHDPVSIKRLQDFTGWDPSTTIAQGVRNTLSI